MRKARETLPVLVRLMLHSDIAKNGCIEWTGHIRKDGYGHMRVRDKMLLAHRVSYTERVGPIPKKMTLDHLCKNRKCIKPEHLEIVTLKENIQRAHPKVTHCNRGHEYDDANTYHFRNMRYCRKCNNIRAKIYQRKKAQ